jgi:iron complex outermembrane receptor protein
VQTTVDLGNLVDPLSGLNVTVGGRYTKDESNGTAQSGGYLLNGNTPIFGGTPVSNEVSSSAPTWTAGLDYRIPTTMLYGKVSRGYKSGGIAPQAVTPSGYTYKPEYVTNYEIGSKSDFVLGDIPLRINSAVYYTNYTDIQKAGEDSYKLQFGEANVNAGKAEVEGFETEISVLPIPSLTLIANYSYTYAKYTEFSLPLSGLTPVKDCSGQPIQPGDTMQLACTPFSYVPRHIAGLTARYEVPVPESAGRVNATTTFSYTDKQYTSNITVPDAEPGAWLGGYGLLNASVDWTGIFGSNFDLQLFGTNLTDRTYRISNSNVWNFLYFQSSIYGEPRVFGAQLGYRWGE